MSVQKHEHNQHPRQKTMTTLTDYTDTDPATPLQNITQHDTTLTNHLNTIPTTHHGETPELENALTAIETETTDTIIHTDTHGSHRIGYHHPDITDTWYLYNTNAPYNLTGILAKHSNTYFNDGDDTETTLAIIPITYSDTPDAPYTAALNDTDVTSHRITNPEFEHTDFEAELDTAINTIRSELFPNVDWEHNPDTGYGDWTTGITTLMDITTTRENTLIEPDDLSAPRVTHSLFRYAHSARHVLRNATREYRIRNDPRAATAIALGHALMHCANELTSN